MILPIKATQLSETPHDYAWVGDEEDWEDILGVPDDSEVDRFSSLSASDEARVAAAVCEWVYARLAPHSASAELNRAFLDALWSHLLSGADVDLERRANAGAGKTDGALRLMRELARTAGDLSHSTAGLVRLAQRITPPEHLSTLDDWIGELIAAPPAMSGRSLDGDNPFFAFSNDAPPAGFDEAAYDQFLEGVGQFVQTLFPLRHPRGLCEVAMKGVRLGTTPTCTRALFVEVEAYLLTSDGVFIEGAEATLRACLEPHGADVQDAIQRTKARLQYYANETRDIVEAISDPTAVNLTGNWLRWW